ncbi:MAG: hypothetical protein HY904_09440 [Deltaproteobacteria bacterium]|nr:hypothetical protein [Deltaproteobacteria bacterium]
MSMRLGFKSVVVISTLSAGAALSGCGMKCANDNDCPPGFTCSDQLTCGTGTSNTGSSSSSSSSSSSTGGSSSSSTATSGTTRPSSGGGSSDGGSSAGGPSSSQASGGDTSTIGASSVGATSLGASSGLASSRVASGSGGASSSVATTSGTGGSSGATSGAVSSHSGASSGSGSSGGGGLEVRPLYPVNGAAWTDYVKADGAGPTSAGDLACDAAADGPSSPGGGSTAPYFACIHGGEFRRYSIPGRTACTGLTAADTLGAFDWTCLELAGNAVAVSTGLKTTKRLSDLVDFTNGRWRTNSVIVSEGGGTLITSAAETWWTNPVRRVASGTTTGTAHDVIALPAGGTGSVNIIGAVHHLSITTEPGFRLPGLVSVTGNFLWLEPHMANAPLTVSTGSFVVVRGVDISGTNLNRMALYSLRASIIEDVVISNTVPSGAVHQVNFQRLDGVRVRRITTTKAGAWGFLWGWTDSTPGALNSTFEDLQDTGSAGGFSFGYTTDSTFTNLVSRGTTTYDGFNLGSSVSGCTFDRMATYDAAANGIITYADTTTYRQVRSLGSRSAVSYGVRASGPDSRWDDVLVVNSAGNAAAYLGGERNAVNNLRVFGATNTGVGIYSQVTQLRLANVLVAGAKLGFSSAVDSNGGGFVAQNVTLANTEGTASTDGSLLYSSGRGHKLVSNLLGVNGRYGLYANLNATPYPRFRNVVMVGTDLEPLMVTGSGSGIMLEAIVRLGRDSGSAYCSGGGLDGNCLPTPAGVTLSTGHADTTVLVGPVTSDAANPTDTNGGATFATTLDFENFDSVERGWGRTGAGTWPSADQRGRCAGTNTCQIYDFSLAMGDTAARAITTAIPTGDDILVSNDKPQAANAASQGDCDLASPGSTYAGGLCETRFLKNAVEIMFDGIGDDDTLCESGETCLFSPNAGFYQGHGALESAGAFVDGQITGVTLQRYPSNGR